MKSLTVAMVCGAVLMGYSAQAFAQAALSQKELTTAEAAAKLLQPLDESGNSQLSSDLAKNGVDTQTTLAGTSGALDPYAAGSGGLSLFNCSPAAFSVRTYNSTDLVLLVPYETVTIEVGASNTLKCATESCTLRVDEEGPYKDRAGPQVWAKGDLHNTNSQSVAKGCSIYN